MLTDAIALRIGTVKVEQDVIDFHDEYSFDDGEDIKWFHFSCIGLYLNFPDVEEPDADECAFCPEDLLGEISCYELELGHFEIRGPDTWWVGTLDDDGEHVRICACRGCVEDSMSEEGEAERVLGQVA